MTPPGIDPGTVRLVAQRLWKLIYLVYQDSVVTVRTQCVIRQLQQNSLCVVLRRNGYFWKNYMERLNLSCGGNQAPSNVRPGGTGIYTVIPRITKIIRSGITFVSRNVISRRFL